MAAYSDLMGKAEEGILTGIKRVQEATVPAVSTITERVGDILPDLPELPIAEYLPTPGEAVESYFRFVERLTKANKAFALDLVQAFTPLTAKVWGRPSGKRTAKAAA